MIESQAEAVFENNRDLRSQASARTLRVLTLTPFYPNSQNSSEGCFIAEVLPWSKQLGIQNQVIAVRPRHRGEVHSAESEIPCAWVRYLCLPGNLGLPTAGSLLAHSLGGPIQEIYGDESLDLIHAHAALPCGDAAERLSRALGIPFVVSIHGLDVFTERQAGKALGRWCRRVSETVYRRASAVICISEKIRDRVGSVTSNSRVIYNGVDAQLFSLGRERMSRLTVLSVGNLIPTKGHALLLRGFAQISSSVPDCQLEIIGEGPERPLLARLTEQLGIGERVHFLGKQTREEVAHAMKRCAVFALPSRYEGLGCVYLEAMASAKPVIGCEGQGIDEIVEHGTNGLLVPPGSEPHLCDALRMLLENQDFRRRLGSAARDTVLRRHTIQHQSAQLAGLYRECAA